MKLSHTANDAARAIVRHIESLPGMSPIPMMECVKITAVIQAAMNATPHNPARLTPAQVGRKPWRLLDLDEITTREAPLYEIVAWIGDEWSSAGWSGNDHALTYRTRLTRKQLSARA